MKNLAFKVIDDWVISVHNENSPTDAECQSGIHALRAVNPDRARMLTFTWGGAPTPTQRRRLTEALRGRDMVTAIVSDAQLVRGAATAMSWFNRRIKVFAMAAAEEAFYYVGIPPSHFDFFWRELEKLMIEVEKPALKKLDR